MYYMYYMSYVLYVMYTICTICHVHYITYYIILCCYESPPASWKAFHNIVGPAAGDYLLPFIHSRFSEVETDIGWSDLAFSQCSSSSKVLDGVKARALCSPVRFFHSKLRMPFLYGPWLVHGALSCRNRAGPSPNCCHKLGIPILLDVSRVRRVCCYSIVASLLRTIVPSLPNFTVGTVHSGR